MGGEQGIYYDEDIEYLDLNLAGAWKFRTGNDKDWRTENFEDSSWDRIMVPGSWEAQGYEDYDGYAWYRKEFRLPSTLRNELLYLSLGKIDDIDRVYLNGKEIGEVYDLPKDWEYKRNGYEYNARRIYPVPDDLLNSSTNVIAVRVYDEQWRGGIYEGPIGIMGKDNFEDYKRKYYSSRSFWDVVQDFFE